MMWDWGYYGAWGAFFGGIMMLIFWVAVILLIVWAVRSFTSRPVQEDQAMAVLRRRLAAGEITQDEFEALKKKLGA